MMLRKAPVAAVGEAFRRIVTAFRSGPSRLRLRRRLYLFSAPVLIVLLAAAAKMISVVIAGDSAISDFDRHDIDALRDDISILEFVDVIDPAKTSFAAGDLMVLEGRLADAEARFQESLSRTDAEASCPVRVNLELVQETLGDIATRGNDKQAAENWYNTAIGVVREAPAQCFEGNDDANEDRRAIRHEALPRLEQKLQNLHRPPPPPPAPPETITPPPPPTSLTPTSGPPAPGPGGGGAPSPSPGASPSQGESPGASPPPGQAPGGPPSAGQSPDGAPSPDQSPGGGGQTPGAEPPPGPGPNMPSPQAPEPTMTPGPGPNMPTPPTAAGGDAPVVGPEGGGPDVLNPVSPDRLPSVGAGSAPGQRLGVGSGEPLDRLKDLLDNANAHGENRE